MALLIGFAAVPPLAALAEPTFYGIVTHVSTNNIKVEDPKTNQTLSFELLPSFDQVFSGDGKTTYQMKEVRPGKYVCVIYDLHPQQRKRTHRVAALAGGAQLFEHRRAAIGEQGDVPLAGHVRMSRVRHVSCQPIAVRAWNHEIRIALPDGDRHAD